MSGSASAGRTKRSLGLGAAALFLIPACAIRPTVYEKATIAGPLRSRPAEPSIVHGRRNPLLDGIGHYVFSLPAKLVLWNWSIDNHRISEKNEAILGRYLEVNGLATTQVRLNSYAPHKEFARLRANKDVHAGYKYTLGTLSLLFYTLLPDRLFAGLIGGDHYNPYTNTIHIYSDHSAVLVHEGGHAKDFAQRSRRGGYAFLRLLPFTDLVQEERASRDALSYFYCRRDDTNELNAYPVLYPAYATYVAGYLPLVAGPVVIVSAHVAGRAERADRRKQLVRERKDMFHGTCWVSDEERNMALGLAPPAEGSASPFESGPGPRPPVPASP